MGQLGFWWGGFGVIPGADGEPVAHSVGVVVVHGVLPHPRYEMQDSVAASLRRALNFDKRWTSFGRWIAAVRNPHDPRVRDTLKPLPTITRVRVSGDDANNPQNPYFDVIEAFWSPLDKGKTTFAKVATWLLASVFVPLNSTAQYMASPGKTLYDIGLVAGGIITVIVGLLGALCAAVWSLNGLILVAGTCKGSSLAAKCHEVSAWQVLFDPAKLGTILSPVSLAALALGALGAFLAAQALKGLFSMLGQQKYLRRHQRQRNVREIFVGLVLLSGVIMLTVSATLPIAKSGEGLGFPAVGFVLAALLFVGGRTVATSFITNFFADVQIYTTRDENADFFAVREQILDLVTETLVHACSDRANDGKPYDRVVILAHSLGSTVSLDAQIRFANLCEQEPRLMKNFRRLRAFVTFGSPLEKTKYFFDVLNPSPSAAFEQWRNDAYGSLFTADASVLDAGNESAKGIFWGNYWYFFDAIANELESYRSFLPPRISISRAHHLRHILMLASSKVPRGFAFIGRLVCRNERGHKDLGGPQVIPHGAYLGDQAWFWKSNLGAEHLGVVDIIARLRNASPFAASPPKPGIGGATYVQVASKTAAKFSDRYPPPKIDGTIPDANDADTPDEASPKPSDADAALEAVIRADGVAAGHIDEAEDDFRPPVDADGQTTSPS